MQFSELEINGARRLKASGLVWEPSVGHYVFDETGVVNAPSPFQDRVYFILNYDYFIEKMGGLSAFQQQMLWLPTWHDARRLLQTLGVKGGQVQSRLIDTNAIQLNAELLELYELIGETLSGV